MLFYAQLLDVQQWLREAPLEPVLLIFMGVDILIIHVLWYYVC